MTSTTKRKHSEKFNPEVLYDLCVKLSYKNQNEIEEVFESIRQWLNSNKEDDNTLQAAITYQDAYKDKPLHFLSRVKPPLDIIQAIIRVAPKAVQMENDVLILPIHYACSDGASFDVIQALVNAYPESVKAATKCRSLPLHCACYMDASLDILNFLIEFYPEVIDKESRYGGTPLDILKKKKYAEKLDDNRMLPLHRACKKGYSHHLIRLLAQAYPEGINIKDNAGKTPLEYYTRQLCDEITALLQPVSTLQEVINHIAQDLPIADNEVAPQIAGIDNEPVQQSESEVQMELTQKKININELKSEILEMKSEMKDELNAFKASVQSDMTEIKLEMKDDLNAFKTSVQSDMTEIKLEMKGELNAFKASVQSDMTEIKLEMKDDLNAFKASVQSDMTEIKLEMKDDLNAFKASVQSDMTEIKSMLSQFGAI